MPQINPYWKEQDKKIQKVVIPFDLKSHFAKAIKHQVDVINLPKNHVDQFNKMLTAIDASSDQNVEIELPASFIKYILWKPIRDIFEKEISIEEIASMKTFYKTVYHVPPNNFVSCGK